MVVNALTVSASEVEPDSTAFEAVRESVTCGSSGIDTHFINMIVASSLVMKTRTAWSRLSRVMAPSYLANAK